MKIHTPSQSLKKGYQIFVLALFRNSRTSTRPSRMLRRQIRTSSPSFAMDVVPKFMNLKWSMFLTNTSIENSQVLSMQTTWTRRRICHHINPWIFNFVDLRLVIHTWFLVGCAHDVSLFDRLITKIASMVDDMDKLTHTINDVYAGGAVEGYTEAILAVIHQTNKNVQQL